MSKLTTILRDEFLLCLQRGVPPTEDELITLTVNLLASLTMDDVKHVIDVVDVVDSKFCPSCFYCWCSKPKAQKEG